LVVRRCDPPVQGVLVLPRFLHDSDGAAVGFAELGSASAYDEATSINLEGVNQLVLFRVRPRQNQLYGLRSLHLIQYLRGFLKQGRCCCPCHKCAV